MEDNMNDYSQVTPTLTFDPFEEEKAVTANVHQELKGEREVFDESRLTPEERKMVDDFASKIDLTNSSLVMQFGVGAQKKIADFCQIIMRVRDQRKNHFAKGITVAWRIAEKIFIGRKTVRNPYCEKKFIRRKGNDKNSSFCQQYGSCWY